MRQLKISDLNNVAGGQQTLILTQKLIINTMPQVCVENYYQTHKNNLAAFSEDTLAENLIEFCANTQGFSHTEELEFDFDLVASSLVG